MKWLNTLNERHVSSSDWGGNVHVQNYTTNGKS